MHCPPQIYVRGAAGLACLQRGLGRRGASPGRLAGLVSLGVGGGAVADPRAGLGHGLWAGLWLTFALLAYHPDRWWPAVLAAGMALAVRELAVPFVLLWLVFALVTRRWAEAAGVAALLALFAGGMGLHFLAVEAGRQEGDLVSPGWNGLAGYGLPLMALSRLTGLVFLPMMIAAPLAILPLIGWALSHIPILRSPRTHALYSSSAALPTQYITRRARH